MCDLFFLLSFGKYQQTQQKLRIAQATRRVSSDKNSKTVWYHIASVHAKHTECEKKTRWLCWMYVDACESARYANSIINNYNLCCLFVLLDETTWCGTSVCGCVRATWTRKYRKCNCVWTVWAQQLNAITIHATSSYLNARTTAALIFIRAFVKHFKWISVICRIVTNINSMPSEFVAYASFLYMETFVSTSHKHTLEIESSVSSARRDYVHN